MAIVVERGCGDEEVKHRFSDRRKIWTANTEGSLINYVVVLFELKPSLVLP